MRHCKKCICWRHFVQNRNSVKVCFKHKIEFTIANCTCASRILLPSSVAIWRCVFAIQRMGSHTGVTKVKNLLMYNLRFNGVHFHPSNAVLQMDAFDEPDPASENSQTSSAGAWLGFEEEISSRVVNINFAFAEARFALRKCILNMSNTHAFFSENWY